MKDDIRAAAMAVILVVAGLLWWQVTTLAECRNISRISADKAPFPQCPQGGPYSLSAMLSPLFPAARAQQRPR